MDQAIKESFHNFEHKKEFREVKLKTRQSFREDQVALERRLSKRVDRRSRDGKGMLNGDDTNGVGESKEHDVLSRLESIVLDISHEKEKERSLSTDEDTAVDTGNGIRKHKVETNRDLNDKTYLSDNVTVEKNHTEITNGKSEYTDMSHQNGSVVNQRKPIMNGSNLSNGHTPVDHTAKQNGHITGPSTLLNRPKVSVLPRTAMTPEPRLKGLKGIYQKNPKLTASSSDHLDNISLKGFKPSTSPHGQKVEHQQIVPSVPGAEVTSIPTDGNLSGFSVEQMVTVFRLLRLPDELVYRLCKCKVDGKRFSVFSDSELKDLGMCNPIIRYFRDRTAQKSHKTQPKFML